MNKLDQPQEFNATASYLRPWSSTRSQLFIPDRFFKEICGHLGAHLAGGAHKVPRILGVQGPPGEGKTEMVNVTCAHLGCNTFCISGATLAGKHEGDAPRALLGIYAEARRAALSSGRPSVLIIDDIHLSVAALKETTGHTINSSLLVGALHELANDTQSLANSTPYARVPIIATGNDFSCLPETLTRPGRMKFFTWQPSWQEKAGMVLPIFGTRTPLERERLRWVIRQYHKQGRPLAFFVQLLHEYLAAGSPWPDDCDDILEAAAAFSQSADSALSRLDFPTLNRIARQLHRNRAQSFLRGGGNGHD
jgi:SpoVK/Ycf46/Vps4 family AAA+-type ATPase